MNFRLQNYTIICEYERRFGTRFSGAMRKCLLYFTRHGFCACPEGQNVGRKNVSKSNGIP
jgi:hypothetical protein